MQDETDADDWSVSNLNSGLSRRRALLGTASVAVGATALQLVAGQNARANVSVEQVSIDDATFEAEAVDPVVDVTVAYAYAADSVSELHIELLVDGDAVASESLRTGSEELENNTDLSGRVVDADKWSAADFEVESGESITREIDVTVEFSVVDVDRVVAADSATDTPEIVVEHPNDDHATVGMVGQIVDGE